MVMDLKEKQEEAVNNTQTQAIMKGEKLLDENEVNEQLDDLLL